MSSKAKNYLVKRFLGIGFSWPQANEISKAPSVVAKNSAGYIVPSHVTGDAATFSQVGTTVTVTSAAHTIPATVYDGYKVYVASVTTTGLAIPAGWYSDFARTGTGTYTFTVPAYLSQTATGTIATNIAETTVDDVTAVVAAGQMGLTGKLRFNGAISNNNNAGTKTLNLKLGAQTIGTVATTTAIFGVLATDVFFNKNHAARNTIQSTGVATTVDTAVANNLTATLTNSAASQFVALDSLTVEFVI